MAKESAVPVDTLIKIVKGYTKNPRLDTFIALEKWHSATFDKSAA